MLGIWTEILENHDLVGGYVLTDDEDGKPYYFHIDDIDEEDDRIRIKFSWQVAADEADEIKEDFDTGIIHVMSDVGRRIDVTTDRIKFKLSGKDVTIFPKGKMPA